MQSEELNHIEKKIIEAAENHFPAYNDSAWPRMKALLDKYMPEKDKKRRYLPLLLLLFLVLGGTYLIISAPWKDSKTANEPVEIKQTNDGKNISVKREAQPKIQTEPLPEMEQQDILFHPESTKDKWASAAGTKEEKDYPIAGRKPMDKKAGNKQTEWPAAAKKDEILVKHQEVPPAKLAEAVVTQPTQPMPQADMEQAASDQETLATGNKAADGKIDIRTENENSIKEHTETSETKPLTDAVQTKPPGTLQKSSNLFLSLAAGPDLSAAGTNELGKVRLAYGALLGFTYKEKFTLRTGLMTARKIYSASPESYNPPPVFWTYYPNLKRVEADCSVMEIPLLFSYNFGTHKKHSFSVTTGLSSYLMKRETYDYYYLNSSGQPAHRKYTFRNQNEHYLSVLTLAGGYQRKINNRFAVSLEPYIKVPLEGVGYGKVHLNSVGFSITTDINMLRFSQKK
jgi:hypothetical protein